MENKEKYHKFQMLLFLLLYNAVCFIWASGVGGYSEWSVIGSSMESEFFNNFLRSNLLNFSEKKSPTTPIHFGRVIDKNV